MIQFRTDCSFVILRLQNIHLPRRQLAHLVAVLTARLKKVVLNLWAMARWWSIQAFCGGPQSYLKNWIFVEKVYFAAKVFITRLLYSIVLVKTAMKDSITTMEFRPLDIIKINSNIQLQLFTVLHHLI